MQVLGVSIDYASYLNKETIIQEVEFQVNKGEIIGLIGSNGAGKSSIIKSIIGLMPTVQGHMDWEDGTRNYAFIPEMPIYYNEMTVWEHLEFFATVNSMDRGHFLRRSEDLLNKFGLVEKRNEYIYSLSKGMQQKVMIILGFLSSPPLYILDEPFIGLDPYGVRELLQLIEEERSRGAGILMSTHVLETAENRCSSFVLVHKGSLIAKGTLDQLRADCALPEGSLFECYIHLTTKYMK